MTIKKTTPPGVVFLDDLSKPAIAGRLLRETDLKLAAIAEQVGYESEFAFAKAFKRAYGIAPGASRVQMPV